MLDFVYRPIQRTIIACGIALLLIPFEGVFAQTTGDASPQIENTAEDLTVSKKLWKFMKLLVEPIQEVFTSEDKPEEIDESAYTVINPTADMAVLGNGEYMYRIYSGSRLTYQAGKTIKTRPPGWNWFNENPESKLTYKKKPGFTYAARITKEAILISSGELEMDSKTISPKIPEFAQYQKEFATVTELGEIYPGVDIIFKDENTYRNKTIRINKKPENTTGSEKLIFWEHIKFPKGSRVVDQFDKPLKKYQESDSITVFIKTPYDEIFSIGSAFIYDASLPTPEEQEVSGEVKKVKQIIALDEKQDILSIGLIADADYLSDPRRRYPVAIDPDYFACNNGNVDSANQAVNCQGGVTDLYLRYLAGSNTNSTDLYLGYYANDPEGPATRQPVVKFDLRFLPANQIITAAWFKLYFDRLGLGNYSGTVDTVARKITVNWTANNITYQTVRSELETINDASRTMNTRAAGWYSWTITDAVQNWYANSVTNYGLLVEPIPNWINGARPNWPNRLFILSSSRNGNHKGPYIQIRTRDNQPADPLEPNDTWDSATDIGLINPYNNPNLILTAGDQDWFKFRYNGQTYYFKVRGYNAASNGAYSIDFSRNNDRVTIWTSSVNGNSTDTYLELYNTDHTSLLAQNDDNNGLFSRIDNFQLPGGQPPPPPPPPQADPLEPNDTWDRAHNIGDSQSFDNDNLILDPQGDDDWFKFNYNGQIFYFLIQGYNDSRTGPYGLRFRRDNNLVTIWTTQTNGNTDTYLYLYDTDHTSVLIQDDDGGGSYQSRINNFVLHEPPDPNRDEFEPNDTWDRAVNIGGVVNYTRDLGLTQDDQDWFRFQYNNQDYYFKVRGFRPDRVGRYRLTFTRNGSLVNIVTSETNGTVDTYLNLYGSNHATELAFNDDNGSLFARIENVDLGTMDLETDAFNIVDMRNRRIGEIIEIRGNIWNHGNRILNSVPYQLRIRNAATMQYYTLTNLNPAQIGTIDEREQKSMTMSGIIPNNIPPTGSYQVEVTLDPGNSIAESNEGNNSNTTGDIVTIEQQGFCGGCGGGGGGGAPPPPPPPSEELPDTDSDNFADVEEVFGGTDFQNANQGAPLYDAQYVSYSTKQTDIQQNNFAADPINIRTGSFELTQKDFELKGRGIPINFIRSYNSKIVDKENRVGNGWHFSHNVFYYQDQDTKNIEVYLGGTLTTIFTTNDNGETFSPPKGEYDELYWNNANHEYLIYRTLEGVKYFFTRRLTSRLGIVERIIDLNGNETRFEYNVVLDVPLLRSITDASGRQVAFEYGQSENDWDKIVELRETVNNQNPRTIIYEYDDNKNLTRVTQNRAYDGVTENATREYRYDNNNRLISYTDPRGTILENEYDAEGRVTVQREHNPRIDAPSTSRMIYMLEYLGASPQAPGSTACTRVKNFRDSRTFYDEVTCFDEAGQKIFMEDGEGNIQRWRYDASGMLAAYTDGNGNTKLYEYDARRRMILKTEPSTAKWRTEETYEYENTFNRLTRKAVTATSRTNQNLPRQIKETVYDINRNNGHVRSITNPREVREQFAYDQFGNVVRYIDGEQNITTFTYDQNGNYVMSESITLPHNGEIIAKQYEYDAYGNRTRYVTPINNAYTYAYDTAGNLRLATDPLGNTKQYLYDIEDHPVQEIDALGRRTNHTYDTDIQASLLRAEKSGVAKQKEYDFVGNLTREIDERGNATVYGYSAANRIIQKQTPVDTITYEYDGTGNIAREENSLGQYTEYLYDERNNLTEKRHYKNENEFISERSLYDGFGRTIETIDGNGNITQFTYDLNDNLLRQTDALGGVTSYGYDRNNNMRSIRTPRAQNNGALLNNGADSVTFEYDGLNRLMRKVNSQSKDTDYFYDRENNITRKIDRKNGNNTQNDHITNFEYDALNRLTAETDAENAATRYRYDAVGNLTHKTDPMLRTTVYVYDDFDRLIEEHDPTGNITRYAYDNTGNKTRITYPDNTSTFYEYNAANRLTLITDAQSNTRSYTHDAAGNKLSETDKRGSRTRYTYDANNRLTGELNARGMPTTYAYDANHNRVSESVANKRTTYMYDALNRITRITHPGNKTESFTYDEDGNRVTKTDGNGVVTTYVYDALNHITEKRLPDSTVTYLYDNWDNVLEIAKDEITTEYQYNRVDRRTSEQQTFADLQNRSYNVTRTYHPDGRLNVLTDAAGRAVTYTYDSRGLLENVRHNGQNLASYTYNALGKPSSLTYQNGTRTIYGYDILNRPESILITNAQNQMLFRHDYSYDAESNRTRLIENNSRTITYRYDALEQLNEVGYTNGETGFSYDSWGNRTAMESAAGTVEYRYAQDSNELTDYTQNSRLSVAAEHDGNGNLTRETVTRFDSPLRTVTYTWDAENRLEGIFYSDDSRPQFLPELPHNTMRFVYDDFSNRIKKDVNGEARYYINNGLAVLNELDAEGAPDKSIMRGLEQVAEIDVNGEITFTHQDVLGSTMLLTDDRGAKVREYEYDPFGSTVGMEGMNDGADTSYLFTGQEYDPESELYYYNARYYNTAIGRFISRDSLMGNIGDILSRNTYSYVKNNPLKYIDPTGNSSEEYMQTCKTITKVEDNRSTGEKIFNYLFGVETVIAPELCTEYPKSPKTFWSPEGPGEEIATYTDYNDFAVLLGGKNLNGTSATRLDKTFAVGGAIIPVVSGSGVKNAGEGLLGLAKKGWDKFSGLFKKKETFEMIQLDVGIKFKNKVPGVDFPYEGENVSDVIEGLKNGSISPDELPVGYVKINGRNIIINNRSYSAVKGAGKTPLFEDLTNNTDAFKQAENLLQKNPMQIFDKFEIFK